MDFAKLKVSDLKAELAARNLDTKGVKAVLIERLKGAIEEGNNAEEDPNSTSKTNQNVSTPVRRSRRRSMTKSPSPTPSRQSEARALDVLEEEHEAGENDGVDTSTSISTLSTPVRRSRRKSVTKSPTSPTRQHDIKKLDVLEEEHETGSELEATKKKHPLITATKLVSTPGKRGRRSSVVISPAPSTTTKSEIKTMDILEEQDTLMAHDSVQLEQATETSPKSVQRKRRTKSVTSSPSPKKMAPSVAVIDAEDSMMDCQEQTTVRAESMITDETPIETPVAEKLEIEKPTTDENKPVSENISVSPKASTPSTKNCRKSIIKDLKEDEKQTSAISTSNSCLSTPEKISGKSKNFDEANKAPTPAKISPKSKTKGDLDKDKSLSTPEKKSPDPLINKVLNETVTPSKKTPNSIQTSPEVMPIESQNTEKLSPKDKATEGIDKPLTPSKHSHKSNEEATSPSEVLLNESMRSESCEKTTTSAEVDSKIDIEEAVVKNVDQIEKCENILETTTPPEHVKSSENVDDNDEGEKSSIEEPQEKKPTPENEAEELEVSVEKKSERKSLSSSGKSKESHNSPKSNKRRSSPRRNSRRMSPRRTLDTSASVDFVIVEDEPEIVNDSFKLSWYDSDLHLKINNDFTSAIPLSEAGLGMVWAGVRSNYGVKSGKVVYEVKLVKLNEASKMFDDLNAHELRCGWSIGKSNLQLGENALSFAYDSNGKKCVNNEFTNYGIKFNLNDLIGVHLDLDSNPCTIEYSVNNISQGIAFEFELSSLDNQALFPHICSRNIEFQVNFGQLGDSLLNNIKQKVEKLKAIEEDEVKIEEMPEIEKLKGADGDKMEQESTSDKTEMEAEKDGSTENDANANELNKVDETKGVLQKEEAIMETETQVLDKEIEKNMQGDNVQTDVLQKEEDIPMKEEISQKLEETSPENVILKEEEEKSETVTIIRINPEYIFVNSLSEEERVFGIARPDSRKDCEVIMMVGLPGCGKTFWAQKYASENIEKSFNIIGIDSLLERMKIFGEIRKPNVASKWEKLLDQLSRSLPVLQDLATKRRRNYIFDQPNVYASGQRRKIRGFGDFKRTVVVVIPEEAEFKRRFDIRLQTCGKIPDSTINEMKANFSLPALDHGWFTNIVFSDLDEEKAKVEVEKYNENSKKANSDSRSSHDEHRDRDKRSNDRDNREHREHRSRWNASESRTGGNDRRNYRQHEKPVSNYRNNRDDYNQYQGNGYGRRDGRRWPSNNWSNNRDSRQYEHRDYREHPANDPRRYKRDHNDNGHGRNISRDMHRNHDDRTSHRDYSSSSSRDPPRNNKVSRNDPRTRDSWTAGNANKPQYGNNWQSYTPAYSSNTNWPQQQQAPQQNWDPILSNAGNSALDNQQQQQWYSWWQHQSDTGKKTNTANMEAYWTQYAQQHQQTYGSYQTQPKCDGSNSNPGSTKSNK